MYHPSLEAFLKKPTALERGPVALVFAEDDVEIGTTLRHHRDIGFKAILALMPDSFQVPHDLQDQIHRIRFDPIQPNAVFDAVNQMIEAAPGTWMYYCYNSEYLFYPFSEHRSIAEMLAFHTEERRNAMLTYVIDLYADDLDICPSAVSLERAHLDRTGYYALARNDTASIGPKERQLDFFGGLRWRFEEHVPKSSRRIDRVALFRARAGLRLRANHTFNDEEYNTYACPWHNNLTAAICSFRTAKALKRNPGSTFDIPTFLWHNSEPFHWHSKQLLDLGLMEPGQWF